MKKATFITIFLAILVLITYFYVQQDNIKNIIENIPETNKELLNKDSHKTISDIFQNKPLADNHIIITIGKNKVACDGLAQIQCLVVNGELFYGDIDGFRYEPDYMYRLEVEQVILPEPIPADTSSWYYRLVRIISKDLAEGEIETDLLNTSWVWESYTEDGNFEVPAKPNMFTLVFSESDRVSGTTDCNNYFGTYTIIDDSLVMGQLANTLMACLNSQEALYQNLLSDIETYSISEDILTLYGSKDIEMIFHRQEKTLQ